MPGKQIKCFPSIAVGKVTADKRREAERGSCGGEGGEQESYKCMHVSPSPAFPGLLQLATLGENQPAESCRIQISKTGNQDGSSDLAWVRWVHEHTGLCMILPASCWPCCFPRGKAAGKSSRTSKPGCHLGQEDCSHKYLVVFFLLTPTHTL